MAYKAESLTKTNFPALISILSPLNPAFVYVTPLPTSDSSWKYIFQLIFFVSGFCMSSGGQLFADF